MFALIALIVFVLAVFGVKLGELNMIALGLVFVCLHLLVGLWPFGTLRIARSE